MKGSRSMSSEIALGHSLVIYFQKTIILLYIYHPLCHVHFHRSVSTHHFTNENHVRHSNYSQTPFSIFISSTFSIMASSFERLYAPNPIIGRLGKQNADQIHSPNWIVALGLGVFWSFVRLFQWSMALCFLYQLRVQQVTSLRTLVFAQHFLVLSHEGTNFDYKVVSSWREGCGCKGWGWKAGGYFLCHAFSRLACCMCCFCTYIVYMIFLKHIPHTSISYIYLKHIPHTSISYIYLKHLSHMYIYIYIYIYQYIYIDVYVLYI